MDKNSSRTCERTSSTPACRHRKKLPLAPTYTHRKKLILQQHNSLLTSQKEFQFLDLVSNYVRATLFPSVMLSPRCPSAHPLPSHAPACAHVAVCVPRWLPSTRRALRCGSTGGRGWPVVVVRILLSLACCVLVYDQIFLF